MAHGETPHGPARKRLGPLLLGALFRARGGLAAALIAIALVVWLYRLWKADLHYALVYSGQGDDTSLQTVFQELIEDGRVYEYPRLGAPFGATSYGYPLPEPLQLGALRFFSLLGAKGTGALWNAMMLAPYVLTAVTTYAAMRMLRADRRVAILMGVVYTFLPYHLMRCTGHLLLASYWSVPLAMALAVRIARGDALFFNASSPWRSTLSKGRAELAALAILVVAGLTGSGYYEFFSAVILGFAGVIGALKRRALAPLWSGALSAIVVSLTFLACIAPSLLYARSHDGRVSERFPQEAEWYGLKIGQLLIPQTWHRWGAFETVARKYDDSLSILNENHTSSFGVVCSIGFLALLGILFSSLRPTSTSTSTSTPTSTSTLEATARLGLFTLLFGTIGGFGALFAVFVSPSIRCYNRISIYVAFFSLVVLAMLIERHVVPRLTTGARHVRFAGVLFAVGAFAIYDQTATSDDVPYAATKQRFLSHRGFVERIEKALPQGAMVYQLPYVPFPDEAQYAASLGYSQFQGFLHSKTLRWSYGDLDSKPHDDWNRRVSHEPPQQMLETLAYAGFSAVWVSRKGYPESARELENELVLRLGPPIAESDEHDVAVFDLRTFTANLHARIDAAQWEQKRDDALHPVYVGLSQGFYAEERDDKTGRTWRWCKSEGTIVVDNPSDHPKRVRVHAIVGGAGTSMLSFDGVLADTVEVRPPMPYSREVDVPPGVHVVHVRSTSPNIAPPADRRDLRFFLEGYGVESLP